MSVEQAFVSKEKVEEPVQSENDSSVETVEEVAAVASVADSSTNTGVVSDLVRVSVDGGDYQHVGQNLLDQLFGMMKALATGCNLQSLVEQSASKDIQTLEGQLRQFSALYGDMKGYLAQWKRGKTESVEQAADETSVGADVKTVGEEKAVEIDVEAEMVEEKAVKETD